MPPRVIVSELKVEDPSHVWRGDSSLFTLSKAGPTDFQVFDVARFGSFRVDASLVGTVGQRVRVTLAGKMACETNPNFIGQALISSARTLASSEELVMPGAGPLWLAPYLHVRTELEVDLGVELKMTLYVRGGRTEWVMPSVVRGEGLTP